MGQLLCSLTFRPNRPVYLHPNKGPLRVGLFIQISHHMPRFLLVFRVLPFGSSYTLYISCHSPVYLSVTSLPGAPLQFLINKKINIIAFRRNYACQSAPAFIVAPPLFRRNYPKAYLYNFLMAHTTSKAPLFASIWS